ncbi:MAG TPA: glutamyl-tRNA amidotransferase [Microscillaceae bacterium]|nr:glutamyl-tRNA amidotransferase [Microscillaceae bacterium]
MSLKSQIDTDIKEAMKSKDKDALRALRAIKSLIMLEETKDGNSGALSEADEIQLLSKAAKQRRESARIYHEQDRAELAKNEEDEIKVIEKYLPKQLSEDELKEKLNEIISQVGATGPKDMGKVMGNASKALAGQADGKAIANMVKTLLANIS